MQRTVTLPTTSLTCLITSTCERNRVGAPPRVLRRSTFVSGSPTFRPRATNLLQRNLSVSTDWIVLNVTLDVLTEWAEEEPQLAGWLAPVLERLQQGKRTSLAKRAAKRHAELSG